MANELRTEFLRDGINSMSEDEIRTMVQLNEKTASLLPEQDRSRLLTLIKQVSDAALDSLKR